MRKHFSVLLLLACASSLFAEKAPVVTQQQLDKLTAKWVNILKLQDWSVETRAVSFGDLTDGVMAESHLLPSLKLVRISVLDPKDYEKASQVHGTRPIQGKAILADIEDSILHELIHLRLHELMSADQDHLGQTEELTVVRLTAAVLEVQRRGSVAPVAACPTVVTFPPVVQPVGR